MSAFICEWDRRNKRLSVPLPPHSNAHRCLQTQQTRSINYHRILVSNGHASNARRSIRERYFLLNYLFIIEILNNAQWTVVVSERLRRKIERHACFYFYFRLVAYLCIGSVSPMGILCVGAWYMPCMRVVYAITIGIALQRKNIKLSRIFRWHILFVWPPADDVWDVCAQHPWYNK